MIRLKSSRKDAGVCPRKSFACEQNSTCTVNDEPRSFNRRAEKAPPPSPLSNLLHKAADVLEGQRSDSHRQLRTITLKIGVCVLFIRGSKRLERGQNDQRVSHLNQSLTVLQQKGQSDEDVQKGVTWYGHTTHVGITYDVGRERGGLVDLLSCRRPTGPTPRRGAACWRTK